MELLRRIGWREGAGFVLSATPRYEPVSRHTLAS